MKRTDSYAKKKKKARVALLPSSHPQLLASGFRILPRVFGCNTCQLGNSGSKRFMAHISISYLLSAIPFLTSAYWCFCIHSFLLFFSSFLLLFRHFSFFPLSSNFMCGLGCSLRPGKMGLHQPHFPHFSNSTISKTSLRVEFLRRLRGGKYQHSFSASVFCYPRLMTSCSRTSTQTSSPRPHKPLKLATSRGRVPSERHFWNPSPTDRFSFFLTPLVPGLRLAWGARVYCSGIAIPAPGHLVRDEETPQQHQGKTKTRQMHKPTRSAPPAPCL